MGTPRLGIASSRKEWGPRGWESQGMGTPLVWYSWGMNELIKALEQGEGKNEMRRLEPHEKLELGNREPIASREETRRRTGCDAEVLAAVQAGDNELMILDLRNTPTNEEGYKVLGPERLYKADYLLVDKTFGREKGKGFKGIRVSDIEEGMDGAVYGVGREYNADRFNYSKTISRHQFDLAVHRDGSLVIMNGVPTNATNVIFGREKSEWDHLDDSRHYWAPEAQDRFES